MKTQNTNNTTQILKSFGMLALIVMIAIGSAFAGNGDSVKAKKNVSTEEAAMIDDLLAEMEEDITISQLLADNDTTFEIYDVNDELLFKGNDKQWNSQTNEDLITMKRKAEFLMENEGTSIYKIF
ncbi:MAG: hypothetical protein WBA74_13675 [Cyclobacteriaceae bacterium]